MPIETLDHLIARLQQTRLAAGRDLPVRLKLEVHDVADDMAPAQMYCSEDPIRVQPCIGDGGEFVQLTSAGIILP
jgi:hypothetical protein